MDTDPMDMDASDPQKSRADDSSSTPMSFQGSSTVAVDDSSAPTEPDDDKASLDDKVSLDDQVHMVHNEINTATSADGQVGYVVSRTWLGRVVARSKYSEEMGPFDKACLEGEIGPVDNADIIDAGAPLLDEQGQRFVPLKRGLRMDMDLHVLPASAWDRIMKWYGLAADQNPVVRYQHQTTDPDSAMPAEYQYELYPPIITIRKHHPEKSEADSSAAPRIVASRSQTYMDFLKAVKKVLGIPLPTKVKMSRVLEVQPTETNASMPTPEASRDNSPLARDPPLVMDEREYDSLSAQSQIEVLDIQDGSMNENHNGRTTLGALGLGVDQTLVLFAGKEKTDPKRVAARAIKDTASEAPSSGRASPAIGMMTRGRNRIGRAKGTVGLTNLGNTCYMNSALQCMRACKELSLYFLGKRPPLEDTLTKQAPRGSASSTKTTPSATRARSRASTRTCSAPSTTAPSRRTRPASSRPPWAGLRPCSPATASRTRRSS
jgi:ubiquitin carboxyl-terminal hydrolase 4/11/15